MSRENRVHVTKCPFDINFAGFRKHITSALQHQDSYYFLERNNSLGRKLYENRKRDLWEKCGVINHKVNGIYIYIYIYTHTHTHTHTGWYIYIYIYMYI